MKRLVTALAALVLLRADMYQDASNAKQPQAQANLGGTAVNVQGFGALPDAVRLQCAVTTLASNAAATIAAPCAFAPADVGKPIVVWNAGATAAAPLATTIQAVADATHITLAAPAGQTLAASPQYVSWGTDNSAAIAAAYVQAAKQADPAGQHGYVYFPPGIAEVGGAKTTRWYGTTAAVGVAPNAYRIGTLGAGPYNSRVLALAPIANTAGLVFESAGYDNGNVMRDVGFDGNMLAANVAYLACSPNGRLDNVAFSTPAAGGIILKVGQSGSSNCPGLVATAVRFDSTLATDPAQYPAKQLEINSSDTTWHSPFPSGPASQYGIHVASTAANTAMFAPHTAGLYGTAAIQTDATVVWLDDPQIDNAGAGTLTGIVINGASNKVIGGRMNLPAAASVGIVVNASKAGAYVSGFDCNRFSTPANCIQLNYPLGANPQIFANGSSTIAPAAAQKLNQFPAGTTNTTGVAMGMSLQITPVVSGFVEINFQGNASNSGAGNGSNVSVRYGTGAVPANGDACTGTGGAVLKATSGAAGAQLPLGGTFLATMTPGTAHWVDLCVAAITSGTATIANADLKLVEQNRW